MYLSMNFLSVASPSSTHIARDIDESALPPAAPSTSAGSEFASSDYTAISASDDSRVTYYAATSKYPCHQFMYQIPSAFLNYKNSILEIRWTYEGYGGRNLQGNYSYSTYVYIWNASTSAWVQIANYTTGSDVTTVYSVTSNISNYIDSNNRIWLKAVSGYPAPSNGTSFIITDFAKCELFIAEAQII
jgi:hypothetical protein